MLFCVMISVREIADMSIQISFYNYIQSCGMQLETSNEWIELAEHIPWDICEAMYAVIWSISGSTGR